VNDNSRYMVLIVDFVPICREYQRIYVLALVVSSLFSDCEFGVLTDRNKCNRPLTILQYSVDSDFRLCALLWHTSCFYFEIRTSSAFLSRFVYLPISVVCR